MKYLSIFLGVVLLFSFPAANVAADAEKEVLKEYSIIDWGFENTDKVSRSECLVAIMNAAGITEEISNSFQYLLVDEWSCEPHENAYYDGSEIYTDDIAASEWSSKYCDRWTYFDLAFYHGIAKGSMLNGKRCFFFDKPVTAKEALTFMLRFVEKTMDIPWDEVYAKAKARNLLKETDAFYNDEAHLLTSDEFCVLLNRFLAQPRYIYFSNNTHGGGIEESLHRDEELSMTYNDYLKMLNLRIECNTDGVKKVKYDYHGDIYHTTNVEKIAELKEYIDGLKFNLADEEELDDYTGRRELVYDEISFCDINDNVLYSYYVYGAGMWLRDSRNGILYGVRNLDYITDKMEELVKGWNKTQNK